MSCTNVDPEVWLKRSLSVRKSDVAPACTSLPLPASACGLPHSAVPRTRWWRTSRRRGCDGGKQV